MTSIASLVHAEGGLLHKRQLVQRGADDRHLTWAVRTGEVRRPRRGWYSTWPPGDARFIAVRIGGRLTGAAALAQLGAWLWETPRITVSVPKNASRLRRIRGTRVVWDDPELSSRGSHHSVGLRDALREALLELPFGEAVAVLDWAVHSGRIDIDDVPLLVKGLPQDVQEIAAWVDEGCESIIESLGRTRLRVEGHRVETQVPVDVTKRIDIVVDGVVGLELDGREFHQDTFETDRCKDLEIIIEGRTAIRASYQMVRGSWHRVALAIDRALAAHRGTRVLAGNSGPSPQPARRGPRLWRLPVRRRPGPELPNGVGVGGGGGAAGGEASASTGAGGGGVAGRDAATASHAGGTPRACRRRGLTRRIATIVR